jgi:cephalosporin hydroxylase
MLGVQGESVKTTGQTSDGPLRRYLDLLRDALLDEHYLENELRIEHLLESVGAGPGPDPQKLANPTRYMAAAVRRRQAERRAGELARPEDGSLPLAFAPFGRTRLDHLEACLAAIDDEDVPGDLVEVGTGPGGAAIFMRGFLAAHEVEGPRVWVADRFDGRGATPDLNTVRDRFARFGLLDDRVAFLEGAPARTLVDAAIEEVALLRIGSADPEDASAALDALYDDVAPGGVVIVDAYGNADCQAAVDTFRSERGVAEPLERVDWSAATWRKTTAEVGARPRAAVEATPDLKVKDLAVVVVFYNMRREAARTLHSLSRSYQQGIDGLDYEVIAVENGSDPEQRLGEEFVAGFGPEFRYLDLGDEASPSPARAINRGIAASASRVVTLMIDGAHVLTPGVLHFGMLGMEVHEPAIVTAKQWYVGPGQQPQAVAGGYDSELEDRLFSEIDWPTDGYRLFEIGHFIGDRDWFDGEWESNCIFVPRAILEQVGAMDESFQTPGGGFVNLDFFERMVGTPGVTQVTMLGEGSFHQVHGGTTTNLAEPDQLIRSYDDQYEELRGRRFHVPPQQVHYIGSLTPAARRTKPRRMNTYQRFKNAHLEAGDGRPARPMPVAEELRDEFIDAFWRSGEWHRVSWLGKPVHRPPTDLFAYQELIFRLRPDWIIETRTGAGGRALFLASICDLVDSGQVVSIDNYPLVDPPQHPRITYLRGDPSSEDVAARVRDVVGEPPNALVIVGGTSGPQVAAAYATYASLVPVGSYLVVEDTILGGNPVWPAFGSRPAAAVQEIIGTGEFVPDPSLERLALTFNRGGYLRRVR